MPQHVRPHVPEPGALAGLADDVIDGLANQLLPALRHEQPGQLVLARRKVALDRSEFVASERLLAIVGSLGPLYPDLSLFQVDLIETHADSFGNAQPVPIDHEHQSMISDGVPSALGRLEQPIHF